VIPRGGLYSEKPAACGNSSFLFQLPFVSKLPTVPEIKKPDKKLSGFSV